MADWFEWKALHFVGAIKDSRLAKKLIEFSKTNDGWQAVVQQLFINEPSKLNITSGTSADRLVKAGLICHAPKSTDFFTFSSPAIRLLLIEYLTEPALRGLFAIVHATQILQTK
jgi:hypothetical protein